MIARALGWSTAASVLGALTQLGLMAALARLLGPAEFGLVASAALAMRFVSYFSQMGLGPALVQRKDLDAQHQMAALISAFLIGLACWALFILLALPFSVFFRDAALREVLMVTPASLMLGSLASVPQAILRRGLRFKALALVDLTSLSIGYGVTGILLAIHGFGVWSIVVAAIAQQGMSFAVGMVVARFPLGAIPERRHFSDLLGYGSRYSFVGFLDFLSSNVETLFVGRMLGMERLGLYNRAQTVTNLPVEQFMTAVGRVMFPVYSNIREGRKRLREVTLLSIHLSTLLTFPIACGMSVAAENLVIGVLGGRWHEAVEVARVSVWCVPALYISTFTGSALDALARFRGKAGLIGAVTLLKLSLMWVFGSMGLVGIAVAMVIAEWVRAFGLIALLHNALRISYVTVLPRFRHGIVMAICAGGAIALSGEVLAWWGISQSPELPLAVDVTVGAVAFVLLVRPCLASLLKCYGSGILDLAVIRRLARI